MYLFLLKDQIMLTNQELYVYVPDNFFALDNSQCHTFIDCFYLIEENF